MSDRATGAMHQVSPRRLALAGARVIADRGSTLRMYLMIVALAAAFSAGAGVAKASQEPRHPTLWAGAEWKAFDSRQKQAYLSGFIAGATAEQALALATTTGGTKDSAVPSGAIAKLRAEKQLHFPYAPTVYGVQVDDYYWWTDHLGTPIAEVMLSVNRQMLHP